MNFQYSSTAKKPHESKFEVFHIRQNARLCIGFVCLVHFFSRFTEIKGICQDDGPSRYISRLSLPFGPIITLIVAIEYILVRRKGSKILKYSQLIDLMILFLFTVDWILGLVSAFTKSQDRGPRGPGMGMHPHDHDHGPDGSNHMPGDHGPGNHGPRPGGPGMSPDAVMAIYQFVNFAWKALLVTLIVQKWQLKIIAPSAAIITATVYACIFDEKHIHVYIIRCAAQLFNTTFIIYCEDRIKWKIIWTTLQQEKWMQVNNFILNNIPENIMILDVSGQVKFISDYCKSFMEKCNNLSLETKEFFSKIQNLHQQKYELDPPEPGSQTISGLQMERAATGNNLLSETAAAVLENNPGLSPIKVETLTDLITNFKDIAKEKNLQEKQFLIYNGKLKTDQHEKSIEIKVSFIQHFEDDYVVLILRDTTQRDLLVTLEETNKYKDQLLASVSHELRAPLNGNINLVESAINSRKIPGHIKETLLTPALRSSKFLLHIINDILDMSQIKEKKLRLTFQNKDLQETFKSTAQLVELQAKKKGIELLLEFDPNLPRNLCTDHVRVSQIVLNLLNNAMKFTKQGTIKLLTEPTMDNPKWVKISVIDSGIGMNQENVKKLFSNYTHIEFEGRQSMNPTGVGLGLNIAYNLVQLLAPKEHQTIDVISAPNQGSTFSFVLEDQQTEDPIQMDQIEDLDVSNDSSCRVAADEASTELKSKFDLRFIQNTSISMPGKYEFEPLLEACSCPKVLIVDDNPFNTMAFETILNSLNMKCDSVYSGSCAIEKLLLRETKKCGKDCKPYSTVFMDQEMPEMDGIQTTKEIRRLQGENSLSQEMKIIGCTAHHSKQEVDKFVEAGLDKCIHKPISASMINDIL